MPVGRVFDYVLNGNGYMLLRQQGARSWVRGGKPDTPDQRAFSEEQYGVLPSDLERPVVWDDWSGGYGEAYRRLNRVGFHLAESNKYHWAENFDTRFPKQLVHAQQPMQLSPAVPLNTIFSVYEAVESPVSGSPNPQVAGRGQVWFVWNGGYARELPDLTPSTQASWITAVFDNKTRTGQSAIFGSYVYIADRTGTYFQQFGFDGTASSMTTFGAGFLNAGNRLWKWHGNLPIENYVQSLAAGADPTVTSNWSATLPIGPGNLPIRRGIALKDTVYFGMADGLYAGDQSGTFINVLSELKGQVNIDNCRDLTIYQGEVVTPHLAGIYSYLPSTTTPRATEIGPVNHSNRSVVQGQVRAVKAYGPWLYAGLWNGSQNYLLAGRPHNDPNVGERFQWHVLQRFPAPAPIGRIFIDGITVASNANYQLPVRMYALLESSGIQNAFATAPVYWWPIPAANDNPLNAVPPFSANYVGSARIDLGYVDFQAPSTPKIFRSVEVTADKLASGAVYANVYYTVDNGTRTLLGLVATSPKSTLFFPNGSGNWVGGHAIELSLESFTATQALTPIYRSIVLRGSLRPRSVDLITAVTRIADRMHNRQNTEMRPGAVQVSELRALASSSYPSTLVDIAGATQIVDVLEPIEEHEIWQEGADSPELAVSVKMAVLSFTSG